MSGLEDIAATYDAVDRVFAEHRSHSKRFLAEKQSPRQRGVTCSCGDVLVIPWPAKA
jgi:hypothetical protein